MADPPISTASGWKSLFMARKTTKTLFQHKTVSPATFTYMDVQEMSMDFDTMISTLSRTYIDIMDHSRRISNQDKPHFRKQVHDAMQQSASIVVDLSIYARFIYAHVPDHIASRDETLRETFLQIERLSFLVFQLQLEMLPLLKRRRVWELRSWEDRDLEARALQTLFDDMQKELGRHKVFVEQLVQIPREPSTHMIACRSTSQSHPGIPADSSELAGRSPFEADSQLHLIQQSHMNRNPADEAAQQLEDLDLSSTRAYQAAHNSTASLSTSHITWPRCSGSTLAITVSSLAS